MSAVPKLRFPEFDGEFETKLLEEIADVYQPKTISQSDLIPDGEYVVYGANGVIGRYSAFNHAAEQVAITCRGNTCGRVNFTPAKAWITGNAMVLNMDANVDVSKKFIYYLSTATDWTYQIAGSGQPQITGTIKKHKFQIPTLPEQQKIASFLSSVDKKIDLLRQKKDALELYKKGLMQKIFSQDIRFKQDDGSDFPEWEEMRLEEVADMKAGKFIKASEISPTNQYGFFPCYGGNGLRGYVRTSNQEGRYVLIGRQGALCGNVAITTGKFYATEHAVVTRAKSGNEIDWLFYQLEKMDLNQYAIGVAQPGLSVTSLNSLATLVPSRPEQAKIASFLSTIDTKIASVASQLEQMETFKKGLLQQMFV